MTFDDYILKQDHIRIDYWGEKPSKTVLSLEGIDLKDVWRIEYYKYDSKENKLLWHRLDGPALIYYYPNGNVNFEVWYQNGFCHRLDSGPTMIGYYKSGIIKMSSFG